MRKVTCNATNEKGNSDEFYKADDGKYYKSEDAYNEYVENKNALKGIYNFLNKKILYGTKSSNNSMTRKLINESGLKYSDILLLLNEKYDDIKNYMADKENLSPTSKLMITFKFITSCNTSELTYAGCYMIQNKNTNEIYVGESIDLFSRFQTHIADLYDGIHHCKKLQDAFDKAKSIRDFTIRPLYLLPIASIDKKKEKEETLYLETAFYMKFKYEKNVLYNSINPYMALKNGNAKYLESGDVDAKEVLKLLYDDKYKILPHELKTIIRNNLKSVIPEHIEENKNDEISFEFIKSNNYILGSVFTECVNENIFPEKYDYSKVRKVLKENDIIDINEKNRSIATATSLENNWIVLKDHCNPTLKSSYYITEGGKDKIKEVLSKYKSSYFDKLL